MKKTWFILLGFLIGIIFYGCSTGAPNFPSSGKKPSNSHYTNLLVKAINTDASCSVKIYETNLHKEKDLTKDGIESLRNFFKLLSSSNFIKAPSDIPQKPQYKIFVSIGCEKHVINVYSEKVISIYPWDGSYEMDFIDMSGIYTSYNLHGLCRHFFK